MALQAVTAEPGGDEAVLARLAERKTGGLKYEVKSDPEHELLAKDIGDVYTIKHHEWEVSGPYEMVQPAVVVFDADGNVVNECTWSWKTMGIPEGKEMEPIKTQAWDPPPREVPLVTFRPVISDLVASIKERRPVKLTAAMTFKK